VAAASPEPEAELPTVEPEVSVESEGADTPVADKSEDEELSWSVGADSVPAAAAAAEGGAKKKKKGKKGKSVQAEAM
jgi:hypothetical protein